jgi:SAM-dependent methyltransferase
LQRREYERLAAVEDRMWWFRGLHVNLLAAWRKRCGGSGTGRLRILDAGCGTGGFLARLAASAPEATAFGVELDEGACRLARDKSGCAIAAADINALPFADQSFDVIVSADVLCHRGVEEHAALAGFRRCLRPGGVLILNLPAYRWLYSAHDAAVDNARRYDRRELLRLLADMGFSTAQAGYWNGILFPLMLLRRKLRRGRGGQSEVALLPAAVERSFAACLALERGLVAAGIRLPFGGSILATAVRE